MAAFAVRPEARVPLERFAEGFGFGKGLAIWQGEAWDSLTEDSSKPKPRNKRPGAPFFSSAGLRRKLSSSVGPYQHSPKLKNGLETFFKTIAL